MGALYSANIPKETVSELKHAPWPKKGTLLQIRAGKVKKDALGGEITSAIYKQEHQGSVFCGSTGLVGDEHASNGHGGEERAVHQYNPDHYLDWQAEDPPQRHLYDVGSFGENLVTTEMNDDNVCIGDVFQLGDNVLLEVSEPRHPCYKLNSRFQWPRALKRTIRSGRSGWNMRVLQTGNICKGDSISLVKRPYPQWSVLNVQRVTRGRNVSLHLIAECTQLPMTDLWLDIAKEKLRSSPKPYTLVDARYDTERVRKLTFALKDPLTLSNSEFDPYGYVQITFGSNPEYSRSYSVVDGDLYKFTLGVAFDRRSAGGSVYLHKELKVGDGITMYPGTNPNVVTNDEKCDDNLPRILIIGGIGITAFLPSIKDWESKGLPYHVHYAAPSPEEAAFLQRLPKDKTTLYAKSRGKRLNIKSIIPEPGPNNTFEARIFSCGPTGMMKECEKITTELGYPEHMVHYEDFGSGGGGDLGEPFEVEIDEPETKRHEKMTIPSNTTLLDALNKAGFDVLYSCKSGACGACKVTVCDGKVKYKSTALLSSEKGKALQACVDRGIGKLKIELD